MLVAVFFRGGVCRAVSPCFCSVAYFIMSFLPRPVPKAQRSPSPWGMPKAQRSPRSEQACALGGLAPASSSGRSGLRGHGFMGFGHRGLPACVGKALCPTPMKPCPFKPDLPLLPAGAQVFWAQGLRGPAPSGPMARYMLCLNVHVVPQRPCCVLSHGPLGPSRALPCAHKAVT